MVINDPGRPDGAGVEYPLEKFQAALGPGAFHYVATDIAPPSWQSDRNVQSALKSQYALASDDLSPTSATADFSDKLSHLNDRERLEFLKNL